MEIRKTKTKQTPPFHIKNHYTMKNFKKIILKMFVAAVLLLTCIEAVQAPFDAKIVKTGANINFPKVANTFNLDPQMFSWTIAVISAFILVIALLKVGDALTGD